MEQEIVKSVEKTGKTIQLTLQVPPGTNPKQLKEDWERAYQLGLQAGKESALLESAQDMKELAMLLAKRPVSINNKVIAGDDQSQTVEVKGDFAITADRSVISLRDISGQVTSQIEPTDD